MTKPKSAAKSGKASGAKSAKSKESAASKAQKARAAKAQTDPESVGIAGAKQQGALYRGGSLAQRRAGEGNLADAQSQSGNEVTSAAPPNVKEKGRVSSPMFDEVPVTGKAKQPGDGSNSRRSSSKSGTTSEAVGLHSAASLPEDIDSMEPGTTIEKFGGTNPEVRIRTAIAGGAVRIFAGPTFAAALEDLHKFLRGEALVLPTASDQEKKAVAEANEANVRALKGKSTVEGEDGKAAAKKAAAKSNKSRSKSGAKRK
jgi:hypothetical protein